MSHVFRVAAHEVYPMQRTTMQQEGLMETEHLENWVIEHPEVLGDGVMIVTTQFDRWVSVAGDSAKERLDVLGLDVNGQLVVTELKRAGDKIVHLQALTYAALVAGFSQDLLGRVHAQYLQKRGSGQVSEADALLRLQEHVDGDWDVDVLAQPRVILVAEKFPLQVLTTSRWLTTVSGGSITIECIEVSLFRSTDGELCATFNQIWPVKDLEDRMLGPQMSEVQQTQKKIAERTRRARSAKIIADNQLIPEGATLELALSPWISRTVVEVVDRWLAEDPTRAQVTWHNDPVNPVLWSGHPSGPISLTRAAKYIVAAATGEPERQAIPGGDVWAFKGHTLASIAEAFVRGDEATTRDL